MHIDWQRPRANFIHIIAQTISLDSTADVIYNYRHIEEIPYLECCILMRLLGIQLLFKVRQRRLPVSTHTLIYTTEEFF